MKNIKPTYAVELGKGVFAGMGFNDWMCKYCNRHPTSMAGERPTDHGTCKYSPTGYHVWEKI